MAPPTAETPAGSRMEARALVRLGVLQSRCGKLAGLLNPPLALVHLNPEQQAGGPAALAGAAEHIDAPLGGEAGHLARPNAVGTRRVAHAAMPLDHFGPLAVPLGRNRCVQFLVNRVGLEELSDAGRHNGRGLWRPASVSREPRRTRGTL